MTQAQLDKRISELEHIVNTTTDFATGRAADNELEKLYALDLNMTVSELKTSAKEYREAI